MSEDMTAREAIDAVGAFIDEAADKLDRPKLVRNARLHGQLEGLALVGGKLQRIRESLPEPHEDEPTATERAKASGSLIKSVAIAFLINEFGKLTDRVESMDREYDQQIEGLKQTIKDHSECLELDGKTINTLKQAVDKLEGKVTYNAKAINTNIDSIVELQSDALEEVAVEKLHCHRDDVACAYNKRGHADTPCGTCIVLSPHTLTRTDNYKPKQDREPPPETLDDPALREMYREQIAKLNQRAEPTVVTHQPHTETLDEARARWLDTRCDSVCSTCLLCAHLRMHTQGSWQCWRNGMENAVQPPEADEKPFVVRCFDFTPYQPPSERTDDED